MAEIIDRDLTRVSQLITPPRATISRAVFGRFGLARCLLAIWRAAAPLVVHAAVVLVPLSAVGLVVSGWHPRWRRHYAFPVALLAIAGAVAVILAASTGEALESSIRHAASAAGTRANMGEHPEQGETARLFAVLFAGGATAFWAIETWGERLRLQPWSTTATYAMSSVLGVVAIITIVIAGHSGAALVWKDVGNFVSARR